jgi:hypothetical protein
MLNPETSALGLVRALAGDLADALAVVRKVRAEVDAAGRALYEGHRGHVPKRGGFRATPRSAGEAQGYRVQAAVDPLRDVERTLARWLEDAEAEAAADLPPPEPEPPPERDGRGRDA